METRADSALMLLEQIDQKNISSEKDRACYALLYSQALDKNYIDTADDSLINIAVRYYEKSSDLRGRMLSYYYLGRIKYNGKDYPQSLCVMSKAFDLAEQANDMYWSGRVAEQMANIYDRNYHKSEGVHYAELAYDRLNASGR